MDALELLKADHQRVDSLFDQFKNTNGYQGQKEIFHSIHRELSAHAHMEETTFYPAFRNYPEFKEMVQHAFEEHRKVKTLLSEITRLEGKGDPGQYQSKVQDLIVAVRNHVQEEENELFPRVRQLMRRQEREVLGRHLQAARDEQLEAA